MHNRNEILRETRSADGKYFIRAYAKIPRLGLLGHMARAIGLVQVFEGDPSVTGNPEIFLSASRLNGTDLLDELQNAERIGRDYVDSLR